MEINSRSDNWIEALFVALLVIVCIIVLYPLIFVLSASISNPISVVNGDMWLWPKGITFEGYRKVLSSHSIMNGYANTIFYTLLGTAINLVMTVCAAYPLARKDFYGKGVITAFLVFTMFFSGGLIPTYLLVKSLGMVNTVWALVLPGAVGVYNVIIVRTFFQTTIPYELQEAAAIDGYSHFRTLINIVLPLSMPILVVMFLFYSVGHWNSYFSALIYLKDEKMYPLQLVLREILVLNDVSEFAGSEDSFAQRLMDSETIKYAVIMVANLPMLILYPFVQKYFVQGLTIGALKG